jgi:hypothetical protein
MTSPTLLRRLKINEVSSVDRGAGEDVHVVLMKRDDEPMYWEKRDFTQDQRDRAAASGAAMPGGGYPIEDAGDLHDAVQAFGRAKNPQATKDHIKSRARALGLTDKLPEEWSKRAGITARAIEALKRSVASITGRQIEGDLEKTFEQFEDHVVAEGDSGLDNLNKGDDDMSDEIKKQLEAVTKQLADLTKASDELRAENVLLKMSKEHKDYMDTLSGDAKGKFAAMDPAERDECMAQKRLQAELPASVQKALAEAEAVKKVAEEQAVRLAKLEAKDELAGFSKRAVDLGLPEAMGETLMKASRGDAEAFAKVEQTIKGLNEQVAKGGLFNEFGSKAPGAGSAFDTITAKGEELRKSDPKLTKEQAFTKAYEDPNNKDLVVQYKRESMRTVA